MNLEEILIILAGGPGSGCNPDVGKCGRPPGERTVVARQLYDRIKKDGGFTYSPLTKTSPKKGYALSISPDYERIMDARKATPEKIRAIIKGYEPILKKDKRANIGGWFDTKSKKFFFDV